MGKTDLKAVLLLGVVRKASAGASADRGLILYTVDASFLRRQGRLMFLRSGGLGRPDTALTG